MEKVYFNNDIICFKEKYYPLNNKEFLIEKINQLIETSPNVTMDNYVLSDEYITYFDDIIQKGVTLCKELEEWQGITYTDILMDSWINRIRKENPVQEGSNDNPIYHNHKKLNELGGLFIPTYTFVYYIQVPDNLKGNDGALLIKNRNNEVFTFIPEDNDIVIIPGDCDHSPLTALNSSKDRLVLSCNVGFTNRL